MRIASGETIAFSSVMLNLHETMKHLTVIANIVKTVEAQRMSADYIGGDGGGTEQIDMDGDDGDDRAEEMMKCFRARSKTMTNVSEKIRDTVEKLRKCVQENREYERELVNLQKKWQIVPNKIQENEVVTSDTSLSVLTGFGENCNHALSSSKDCQEAIRVHLERLESNHEEEATHKFSVSSTLNRVPKNLRLSIVSRKHNIIMCEACLIDRSSSGSLLENVHQRVQCFEIFTLARAEALTSLNASYDLSNPVILRIPILSREDDVFDLVLELVYNEDDAKKKKKTSNMPSWIANATLDHIQALVLNWRTTRKFSERPLGSGKHASPDASDPSLSLLHSAATYARNIISFSD